MMFIELILDTANFKYKQRGSTINNVYRKKRKNVFAVFLPNKMSKVQ